MKQRADGRWEKARRINGKLVHFYSCETTEKKAERDIERQIISYSQSRSEAAQNKLLFSAVADEWQGIKREEIAEVTWVKSYHSLYDDVVGQFGDYPINEITPEMLLNYFSLLKQKKFSQKSISSRKNILNMIFNFAFVQGLVPINFVSNIPLPSGLRKTPRKAPEQSDIDIIKSHSTGEDFLYFFLAYTGLRISEACALTFKDFDFENNTITVNKKITWISNAPTLVRQTKTEAGTRDVPILKKLLAALPVHWNGYLFSSDGGKTPLTRKQLQRITNHYKRRHGITVTCHQLRHAFAALGIEANLSVKELQYIMGHSDIHTTMDIYAEIRDKQKKEILKKLDAAKY